MLLKDTSCDCDRGRKRIGKEIARTFAPRAPSLHRRSVARCREPAGMTFAAKAARRWRWPGTSPTEQPGRRRSRERGRR